MLLLMKPHVIHALSSEIAFGLHELLRTNAANIHKSDDWFTLFSLLEVVGAAAHPPPVLQTPSTDPASRPTALPAESDSECSDCVTTASTIDKGYTSDSEVKNCAQSATELAIVVSLSDRSSFGVHCCFAQRFRNDS